MKKSMNLSPEKSWVVLDLGGVLIDLDPLKGLWPDMANDPAKLERLERQWGLSRVVRDYETGKLTGLSTFFEAARREIGMSISRDAFDQVFLDMIIRPYPNTLRILEALSRDYPLALLSNIGQDHWHNCQKKLNLDRYFDQVFLSFEMGLMKPDPKIYRQLIQRLDTLPENIIYLDDNPENIKTAKRFGLNAWVCQGGAPLQEKLEELGLLKQM